jgi:hypothetical protein
MASNTHSCAVHEGTPEAGGHPTEAWPEVNAAK